MGRGGLLFQVHEASGLEQPPPPLPFLLGAGGGGMDEGLLRWPPWAGRVLETMEAEEPQNWAERMMWVAGGCQEGGRFQ